MVRQTVAKKTNARRVSHSLKSDTGNVIAMTTRRLSRKRLEDSSEDSSGGNTVIHEVLLPCVTFSLDLQFYCTFHLHVFVQAAPVPTIVPLIVEQTSDESTTVDTLTHATTDTPHPPAAALNSEEAVDLNTVMEAALPPQKVTMTISKYPQQLLEVFL